MPLNRMPFLNINIDNVTVEEAVEYIIDCINRKEQIHVLTPNVDQIVRVEKDIYFKEIYDNAGLILTDGTPLMWISKLYKKPIKEKICGSDLVPLLAKVASEKGISIFLLGAKPGVADKAAQNLKNEYKNIKIAGTYSPPLGFEKDNKEIEKINNMLLKSRADLLFVGMGVPKQDIFIYENMKKYKIPVSFSIGASIDFLAGNIKRAPRWLNKIGLEWFYRFLREPKRLFKRYFIDDIKIVPIAIKYRHRCQEKRNEK